MESDYIVIKKLEQQFDKISTTLNQCQSIIVLSNIIINPKNDSHYLDIEFDEIRYNIIDISDALKAEI